MMRVIGGGLKGRLLTVPKNDTTRPTTAKLRESVFNILQNEIENSEFLDIFAGGGGMGIEALSRGAKAVTFIENDREALKTLEKNCVHLKIETQVTYLKGDYLKMLEYLIRHKKKFDIIFADPPYSMDVTKTLCETIYSGALLKEGGALLIENTSKTPPEVGFVCKNSRRNGKTYLHQFMH